MDVKALARRLGISRSAIYQKIKRKEINANKKDGKWNISSISDKKEEEKKDDKYINYIKGAGVVGGLSLAALMLLKKRKLDNNILMRKVKKDSPANILQIVNDMGIEQHIGYDDIVRKVFKNIGVSTEGLPNVATNARVDDVIGIVSRNIKKDAPKEFPTILEKILSMRMAEEIFDKAQKPLVGKKIVKGVEKNISLPNMLKNAPKINYDDVFKIKSKKDVMDILTTKYSNTNHPKIHKSLISDLKQLITNKIPSDIFNNPKISDKYIPDELQFLSKTRKPLKHFEKVSSKISNFLSAKHMFSGRDGIAKMLDVSKKSKSFTIGSVDGSQYAMEKTYKKILSDKSYWEQIKSAVDKKDKNAVTKLIIEASI